MGLVPTFFMGLVPTVFGIATKQRLLLGHACEIPRCYCPVINFSSRSELRVNSADFEVGENDQIIRKITTIRLKAYRSLEYSRKVLGKFSYWHYKHSVSFCAGSTFISFV